MRRTWKVLLGLLLGLAALTWTAELLVQRTLWRWTERDLQLRGGDLAMHGARRNLTAAWRQDLGQIREILSELTRDDRLLAAAACGASGEIAVETEEFPAQLACAAQLPRAQTQSGPIREMVTLANGSGSPDSATAATR